MDKAIIEDLINSFGGSWRDHDGPELVESYQLAMQQRWRGEPVSAYDPLYEGWLEVLEARGAEALPAALSLLPAFDNFDGRYYLEALEQRLPDALPDALADRVLLGMSRPAVMGKMTGWGVRETVDWACEAGQRERYLRVLVAGLVMTPGSGQAIRAALKAGGDAAVTALLETLSTEDARFRGAAATALEQLAAPESLAGLQRALAAETDETIRAALSAAHAAAAAATVDVDDYPETPEGDAALDAALAALPRFAGTAASVPLTWALGGALSDAAAAWFALAVASEDVQRRCIALPEVRARLEDASCKALLDSRTWDNPSFAKVMLAGDAAIEKSALKPPEEGVEALARVGTAAAIRHLDRIRVQTSSLSWRVKAALDRMAAEREMDLEELLDSAVSTFGFSRHAERVIHFGDTPVTLRLSVVNNMEYLDADGKRMMTLPNAKKGQVTAIRAIKKELKHLKKTIVRLQTTQQQRLHDALTSQRTWPGAPWRRRFVVHPLMYAFSRSLIWEALPADGGAPKAFAVSDDGELVDTDWDEVPLKRGDRVRLLHPVGLSDDERAAWRQVLDDQEALQPFPQLSRVVFPSRGLPDDDEASLLTSWPAVLEAKFTGTVLPHSTSPTYSTTAHYRVGRYDFTVTRGSWDRPSRALPIGEIKALLDGERISRREVPPLIFSELIYLLHVGAGAESLDDE